MSQKKTVIKPEKQVPQQDIEYERLMQHINKIKDTKIQRNMEDEHDLLAARIKRLRQKPVDEPVKQVKKPVLPVYAFIEEPSKPELIRKPVLIRGTKYFDFEDYVCSQDTREYEFLKTQKQFQNYRFINKYFVSS